MFAKLVGHKDAGRPKAEEASAADDSHKRKAEATDDAESKKPRAT